MVRLFASPRGRIGRGTWWLGMVVIIAFSIGASAAVMTLVAPGRTMAEVHAVSFLLTLLTGGMMYCLHAKRFQDRGRAALPRVAPFLALWVADGAAMALGLYGGTPDGETLEFAFGIVLAGLAIWYAIELGCLRGTEGPNAHGQDPALLRAFPYMPREAAGWRPPEEGKLR